MGDPANRTRRLTSETDVRALKFYQVTSIVLLVTLAAGFCFYEYRQHQATPVTILVDGNPIVTVADSSVAAEVLHSVHERQVGDAYLNGDNDIHFAEIIQFKHTTSSAPIDSADDAVTTLASVVKTVVEADVIIVDKKWLVALPDQAAAQETVDDLKSHYVAMPPDDQLAEPPTFVQNVTIERHTVDYNLTRQVASDAAAVLWTPPQPVTYTVQPHQTGWLIAKKFHMSFSDFLRANSGSNINRLSPGDAVVVSTTFPPVDVIVRKISQQSQKFGGTGVRQITLESTYIDGQLTGTPVAQAIVTLHRATPAYEID